MMGHSRLPPARFCPNLAPLPPTLLLCLVSIVLLWPPAAVESLSSARSFLADMSSGERKLYQPSAPGKRGFDLDRASDDHWVSSAPRAGPSRPRRAHSASPTKKTGPLVGLSTQDERKKLVAPESALPALRLSPKTPALALPSTILATDADELFPPLSPAPLPPLPSLPPAVEASPTADVSPSVETPRVVPMALGGDRNSEATGLGDSIHAVPSEVASTRSGASHEVIVGIYASGGPMIALPNTQEEQDMTPDQFRAFVKENIARFDQEDEDGSIFFPEFSPSRPASSLNESLFESLDDIRSGNTVPLLPVQMSDALPLSESCGGCLMLEVRMNKLEQELRFAITLMMEEEVRIADLEGKLKGKDSRPAIPRPSSSTAPSSSSSAPSRPPSTASFGSREGKEPAKAAPADTPAAFTELVKGYIHVPPGKQAPLGQQGVKKAGATARPQGVAPATAATTTSEADASSSSDGAVSLAVVATTDKDGKKVR